MKRMKRMKRNREAIKLLEKTNNKIKFECLFCKEGEPHMIIVMNKEGDVHVHAPFENKYLMSEFMKAIIKEQDAFDKK